MAKNLGDLLLKKRDALAQTFRDLPAIIGEEVVNYTLKNFEDQGWNGDSFEAWQKRKNPNAWGKKDDPGRALLVKTGKLKRSIRIISIQADKVIVGAGGSDIPYAKAHNEGFEGTINQKVKEHLRRGKNIKTIKVKAFKRTIHQQIPKRKFIGSAEESSQLRNQIKRLCIEEIKDALK
ncbi:tail protein [Elizabethkingia phage TCUEAP3]|uniref:phage virion morphogenesis protein n=1 Tax=Elizabethkingia anophelis TaxID=1117645 RepID=UPI0021FE5BB1|nr:tail protein [Elizabethkingia phage TCUEAP3]